jgi:hypothetical protein
MVARMGMGGIGRVWLGGGSWLSEEERGEEAREERTLLGGFSRWFVGMFASFEWCCYIATLQFP